MLATLHSGILAQSLIRSDRPYMVTAANYSTLCPSDDITVDPMAGSIGLGTWISMRPNYDPLTDSSSQMYEEGANTCTKWPFHLVHWVIATKIKQ